MNLPCFIQETFLLAFLALNLGADDNLALPQHFRIEMPIATQAEEDSPGFTNTFAIVRATQGEDINYLGADFEWRRAQVGSKFSSGDVLRTGPASIVDLFLGDNGPILRLVDESLLTLTRLQRRQQGEEKQIVTLLNLQRGRLLGNVKKVSENSRYEILTPQGIAGIRGTRFEIRAEGPITLFTGSALYFPRFFRWRSFSAEHSLVPISPVKLEAGKNALSPSILDDSSPLSTSPPARNIFLDEVK